METETTVNLIVKGKITGNGKKVIEEERKKKKETVITHIIDR